MKHSRPRVASLIAVLVLVGGWAWTQASESDFVTLLSSPDSLEIVRRPPAADHSQGWDTKLAVLPSFTPGSQDPWQVDLRSRDLSALDVTGRLSDLLQANFDSKTVWPKRLPRGFDVSRIMTLGKSPGLGVRSLHRQGIIGKGVGIAIIDLALLVDHVEYKDRLKLYEEIHWERGTEAHMHGPAVASIAVGKTVGVAPGADLYFIAEQPVRYNEGGEWSYELTPVAQAIDRVVEIDRSLPRDRRIRVVSISLGINSAMDGYELAKAAIGRARRAGIETVYVGSESFLGLGREPLADPEKPGSYSPGRYWAPLWREPLDRVLIPMDSRCVAAPNGNSDYAFYRIGGMSWAVPWLAGLFALACQVRPEISWDEFWSAVQATSDEVRAPLEGRQEIFGKIVNPRRLLAAVQRGFP